MDFKKGDIIEGLYEVVSDPMVSFHSTVWKVHHKTLDVDMAMKQPFTGEKPSASDKRVYKARCRKWADLGVYAHIVQCYNVREVDGELLVFSEWCDGGSLYRLINEGELYTGTSEEIELRIVSIAAQILNAVIYAEGSDKMMIHGAISPYNIHVGRDGFIKLSDFAYTHIDPVFRTPEHSNGVPLQPDSDCYQWALVVLAMLNKGWDWKDGANYEQICDMLLEHPENLYITPKSEFTDLLKFCLTKRGTAEWVVNRIIDLYDVELCSREDMVWITGYRNAFDKANALNNMALTCIDNGYPEKAPSFWERALKAVPNHRDTLINLELYKKKATCDDTDEKYILSTAPSKEYMVDLRKRFVDIIGLFDEVCTVKKDYDSSVFLLDELNMLPYFNNYPDFYLAQNSILSTFSEKDDTILSGFSITPIRHLPLNAKKICTDISGDFLNIVIAKEGETGFENQIEIWKTSPLTPFGNLQMVENVVIKDIKTFDSENLLIIHTSGKPDDDTLLVTTYNYREHTLTTGDYNPEIMEQPMEMHPVVSLFCKENNASFDKVCIAPKPSYLIVADTGVITFFALSYNMEYSEENVDPAVAAYIEQYGDENIYYNSEETVNGKEDVAKADISHEENKPFNDGDEELPEIDEPDDFDFPENNDESENEPPAKDWFEIYKVEHPKYVSDNAIPGLDIKDRFLLNEIPRSMAELIKDISKIKIRNPILDFSIKVEEAFKWKRKHRTSPTDSLKGIKHFNPEIQWILDSSDDEFEDAKAEIERRSQYWNNQEECDLLTLLMRALRSSANENNELDKKKIIQLPEIEHVEGAYKRRTETLPRLVERVVKMRAFLLSRIKGQDHVIHAFCDAMFNSEFNADVDAERKRPRAVFTFAGPPGVGKTLLAETAAKYFDLPFKRFDMTEYSSDKSHLGLIGFEATWKDSAPGQLTTFVRENPHCILLFDEIEKAHRDVIQLFYQILDAGILTDKHDSTSTDPAVKAKANVSFKDTIIIFTSNAGRSLYYDQYKDNCAAVPTQVLINALRNETNPQTNAPFFPSAIVSRIATGYPLLFNNLKPHDLVEILGIEYHQMKKLIEKQYGITVRADKDVMLSLLFSKGGATDARQLRASVAPFFKKEIQKVLTGTTNNDIYNITDYRFAVDTDKLSGEVRKLFRGNEAAEILIFSNKYITDRCEKYLDSSFIIHSAHTVDDAIELAGKHDINLVLLDIAHKELHSDESSAEKAEKIDERTSFSSMAAPAWTDGKRLFKNLTERLPDLPIYILENENTPLTDELVAEFERVGARGKLISPNEDEFIPFTRELLTISRELYMQKTAEEMAASHKILSFETAPKIINKSIVIYLQNFEIKRSYETNDASDILSDAERPETRFDDIIGAERAKQELLYFVNYLKNPKKFAATGAKIPKGALLYGNPGTGKTMLAKALAGESNVTFIPAKASNFVNGLVGSGPAAIRELFAKARRYSPSIIFIDEVDTIGRQRIGSSSGSREYEETLNALLAEMDGFAVNPKRPVFVLAATNYDVEPGQGGIGVLDEAFMRRFDSKIKIDLPDKSERVQLLKMLLSKIQTHEVTDADIESIAERSVGLSPAILTNVFQTALRMVTNDTPLSYKLLDEALETTVHGEKKHWGKDVLERTARHECGHALLSWLSGDTPSYLTIVARGDFGGYMQHSDKELDSPTKTKEQLLNLIRTALGGRAAEIFYYGAENGLDTGASSDLAKATRIARSIITRYGMDNDIGIAIWENDTAEESEIVRARVNKILEKELTNAITLIKENKDRMERLVDKLLDENKLTGDQIDEILNGETCTVV